MLSDIQIYQGVSLAPYTTMGVGGAARYFYRAQTESALVAAVEWAKERGQKLFVLGGGSNLLVRDAGFDGLVVRVEIGGLEVLREGRVVAGAGESWDRFVDYTIGLGLAGVECLAGIPGSVGGTPVQNVGAYGQEVAETIEAVRALDRMTGEFVELRKQECRFRYRESLFNTDEPGRFVVTQVRFRLRADGTPILRYAELQRRFEGMERPTLAETARVVREIRRSKGMLLVEGDAECRSAGSFFKNPIVGIEVIKHISVVEEVEVAKVPQWPAGEGKVKLSAAWLLERAGFLKGYGAGPAGISTRHTLAIVNRGGATCADVEQLQREIVHGVRERFGVDLVREPVLLG